jgi:hypothetical protein
MLDDISEIVHEIYPWSTHDWVMTSPCGYTCSKCKATKLIWNDVNFMVYDADGNPALNDKCEYHDIKVVMES